MFIPLSPKGYIPLIKWVGNHGSQRVCTSALRIKACGEGPAYAFRADILRCLPEHLHRGFAGLGGRVAQRLAGKRQQGPPVERLE